MFVYYNYSNWLVQTVSTSDVIISPVSRFRHQDDEITTQVVMKSGEVILLIVGFLEYQRVKVSFLSHFSNCFRNQVT